MARINLVVWDNRAGFTRDANLVQTLLESNGHRVWRHHLAPPPLYRRLLRRLGRAEGRYDLTIFFQNVIPQWLPFAARNALLPNPEHFGRSGYKELPKLDAILCKTRSAVEAFRGFSDHTVFVGFTSLDRYQDSGDTSPGGPPIEFLHVVGQSKQKGTGPLLSLWRCHPEWPPLTVIARPASGITRPAELPANLRFLDQFLDDQMVRRYQNSAPVHLCPSEAEGFGHTLMEGLSCGALVVTLDAPPMNELITPVEGELAGWSHSEPMQLAIRYRADEAELERAVARVLALSSEELQAKRSASRARFQKLDSEFRAAFLGSIAELLS